MLDNNNKTTTTIYYCKKKKPSKILFFNRECTCILLLIVTLVFSDDDVEKYFADAKTFNRHVIPQCESKKVGSASCIHVDGDGRIVHSRDLAKDSGSNKQMLMDMFLRGVIQDLKVMGKWDSYKKRWMSFLMVYSAAGPHHRETYPVMGFGKRNPSRQPGLLMPNPFFATPQWWDNLQSEHMALSESRPWETRKSVALFRGACGPGALPRFKLLSLNDTQRRFDVGFTKVDGYPSMVDCVRSLSAKSNNPDSPRVPKSADVDENKVQYVLKNRVLPHVPQSNFSNFKYLIHMPGSATGSYSRNLQYLWSHGSIILVWHHYAIEHYYHKLIPGTHFLIVDEKNIHEIIDKLEANPIIQKRLRDGARDFARTVLSGEGLITRWHSVFSILTKRQAEITDARRPPIDAACTCDPHLLSTRAFVECGKCSITHLKDAKFRKFLGVS